MKKTKLQQTPYTWAIMFLVTIASSIGIFGIINSLIHFNSLLETTFQLTSTIKIIGFFMQIIFVSIALIYFSKLYHLHTKRKLWSDIFFISVVILIIYNYIQIYLSLGSIGGFLFALPLLFSLIAISVIWFVFRKHLDNS